MGLWVPRFHTAKLPLLLESPERPFMTKASYISLEPMIHWSSVKRPMSWRAFFPAACRLHVEIGFGLGDFLVQQAGAHPDWGIVGLEREWVSMRRALRKIALAGVRNVRLFQMDARAAFERLFEERSVTSIDSLFPCPWPKKRHVRHRLFTNDFLKTVNRSLVPEGEVRIVTDHRKYFEWLVEQAGGTGFDLRKEIIPPRFATKYERKWMEQGQEKFFLLNLVKKRHETMPVKEDIPLKTYQIRRFDHEHFSPSGCNGQIVVEFKDYLFDAERRKAMVRSLVVENGFKQDFWIEICEKGDAWRIRPAKGCGIIPTAGAQRALDLVREALDS